MRRGAVASGACGAQAKLSEVTCCRVTLLPPYSHLFSAESRVFPDDDIEATALESRCRDVDRINGTKLATLEGEEKTFMAKDEGRVTLVSGCIARAAIALKIGAQVILVKNVNKMLVNGTRGVITGWVNDVPRVKFLTNEGTMYYNAGPVAFEVIVAGKTVAVRKQVPLALGYVFVNGEFSLCHCPRLHSECRLGSHCITFHGDARVKLVRVNERISFTRARHAPIYLLALTLPSTRTRAHLLTLTLTAIAGTRRVFTRVRD